VYSKWFSTPTPAYLELVTQLYGAESGERLYRAYRDELSSRERWSHRLDWSGIVVYEAGKVKAHAIVQVIQDKPLAYVGYVESLNDPAAAGTLVHEIRAELRHKHPGRALYLPVNQSLWHTYRFKTRGDSLLPFDPPCQPYYGDLFARLFETKELYSSYRMAVPREFQLEGIHLPFTVRELSAGTRPHAPPTAVLRAGSPLPAGTRPHAAPTAVLRAGSPLPAARLPEELRAIYDLSVSIFQDCHSIPSFAEFAALYGGPAGSFNLRYVLLAEAQGRPEKSHAVVRDVGAGTNASTPPLQAHFAQRPAPLGLPGVQRAGGVRSQISEDSEQRDAARAGGRELSSLPQSPAAQGMPVGFIFALPLGQAVYIKTLGVAPSAQNRHVGRLLFESICRRARADGYETLYGLFMKNDRLITQLLPSDAEKVAEYTLYRGG